MSCIISPEWTEQLLETTAEVSEWTPIKGSHRSDGLNAKAISAFIKTPLEMTF